MADEAKEVEFASRLTIKDLGCDAKKLLKDMAELPKMPIARLYGTASRSGIQEDKTGTGQQYMYFVGSFEGINLQTGEMMQSSKMYLPEGASQTLEHMLNQVHERKGKTASVDFAFEIRLVKTTANKSGYAYETAAILKPEHADPLQRVREVVSAAPKPKLTEVPHTAAKKSA